MASNISTVTNVDDIGAGLWAVRLRLSDGSAHVIVIPSHSLSLERVRVGIAAVMQYYELMARPGVLACSVALVTL